MKTMRRIGAGYESNLGLCRVEPRGAAWIIFYRLRAADPWMSNHGTYANLYAAVCAAETIVRTLQLFSPRVVDNWPNSIPPKRT